MCNIDFSINRKEEIKLKEDIGNPFFIHTYNNFL